MSTESSVYEQHNTHFASVSAYVVAFKGERVATVAFKFPKDGAGRLHAYVHWIGVRMVRGFAGGGGYDKRTAACSHAARKLDAPGTGFAVPERMPDFGRYEAFFRAIEKDTGPSWEAQLRKAGFDVWRAV